MMRSPIKYELYKHLPLKRKTIYKNSKNSISIINFKLGEGVTLKMLQLDEKILAIDIGKGTEDIFYFEPNKRLENCIQIIRPSRAQQLRRNLDSQLITNSNILVDGTIMGGEPWNSPLYKIAAIPNRNVIMTPTAAYSLRYNLDQVKSHGIKIQNNLPDKNSSYYRITTSDIDFRWYEQVFSGLDIDIFHDCDVVLIACQEHGYDKDGGSAREFRMRKLYQNHLEESPFLTNLMFTQDEIPDFAWRFQSNADLAKEFFPNSKILLMDSSPSVILGTILDSTCPDGIKTVINIGNGHTLVMVLNSQWEILAIWEHHTGNLIRNGLDVYLDTLFSNKLTNEFVLQHGGHGYYQRARIIPEEAKDQIVVVGPNRDLLSNSKFKKSIHFAHPLGSMMLSGPAGLLKTYEYKIKNKNI